MANLWDTITNAAKGDIEVSNARLYAAATKRDTYAPTAWQHGVYNTWTIYLYEKMRTDTDERGHNDCD